MQGRLFFSCIKQDTELTRQLLQRLPELLLISALVADSEDSGKLEESATANVARPDEVLTSEATVPPDATGTDEPIQLGL